MDANGNVVRTIKEVSTDINTTISSSVKTKELEITSVNIVPSQTSAKIEWQTNKPTESKVFISGGDFNSKIFISTSGLSTKHSVDIDGLTFKIIYFYEIEAIAHAGEFSKKQES